jgi:fatty acid desaturase
LGFITGAPMLVSYSHYRFQHLHHHRFVGTEHDKELFDYDAKSLRNPIAFSARAWNVMRIPSFFKTLIRMWRGQYPEVFATPAQRNDALVEYTIIASVFTLALVLTLSGVTKFFLLVWFIPWLAFGEFFHFLIELPEHIGCDKTNRDVRVNTRTYRTNPLWFYITNGNNYHIEHHLYPHVAVHKLRYLCGHLESEGVMPVPSTIAAFRALFAGRQK